MEVAGCERVGIGGLADFEGTQYVVNALLVFCTLCGAIKTTEPNHELVIRWREQFFFEIFNLARDTTRVQ